MSRTGLERTALYGFPVLYALYIISPALFLGGVYAYDVNDDANHTFLNLQVARSIMRAFELPLMNVYNNFGTPLLGDPVTLPFSPLALTYAVWDGPLAMTINRAIVAASTLFLAQTYFRRHFAPWIALLCAFVVFHTPGFLWHFGHHHYQMSLLCFIAILLVSEQCFRAGMRRWMVLLFIVLVTMILSVSINIVLLIIGFWAVWLGIQTYFSRNLVGSLRMVLILGAAVAFSWVQTVSFVDLVPHSARVAQGYGETFALGQFMDSVLFPVWPAGSPRHTGFAVFLSLPLFLLFVLGLRRARSSEKAQMVLLALVPMLFVWGSVISSDIRGLIPLVRSTDVTRLLWFAGVPCAFAVGVALRQMMAAIEDRRWLGKAWLWGTVAYLIVLCLRLPDVDSRRLVPSLVLAATMLLAGIACHVRFIQIDQRIIGALLLLACVVGPIATLQFFVKGPGIPGDATHWFGEKSDADFQPAEFIRLINKRTRIASALATQEGQDLLAGRHEIFGAGGRSTLVDGILFWFLDDLHLVSVEQNPISYSFSGPWPPAHFAHLGIRYVLSPRPLPGWTKVSEVPYSEKRIHKGWTRLGLYENPFPTSVAYWERRRQAIAPESFQVIPNGLRFDLTSSGDVLYLTLRQLDGWSARIDDRPVSFESSPDPFMHLTVPAGWHMVDFVYAPHGRGYAACWVLVGLGLLVLATLKVPRPLLSMPRIDPVARSGSSSPREPCA